MKSIFEELKEIKVRKHIVTTIEYDCSAEQKEDEIFDTVREILTDNLNSFSKITYDLEPSEHKVRVEVTQNQI